MDTLGAMLTAYQTALDALAQPADDHAALVMAALLARDRLAGVLAQSQPTTSDLSTLTALDRRLQANAVQIDARVGASTLAAWRNAVQPPATAWWWRLDERAAEASRPSALWTVIAGFFLAVSISLTAEIARRFLAVGPDLVGVFSTLVQGFLTLLAGRSLTDAGLRRLEKTLAAINVHRRYAPIANVLLAMLVMLLVVALRLSLPALARYYSEEGARLQQQNQLSAAILRYQRATSLSPTFALAHYNLGTAYELSLAFDPAIVSYQAALRSDSQMIPAYNNLARVYLFQDRFSNALVLLNIGLDLDQAMISAPDRTVVRYSLYKNRAWANLGLKYINQAQSDAASALDLRPDGAAAHCLMAQVLEARNDMQSALTYWENCLAYEKLDTFVPAEARWLGLAHERLTEAAKK
jgi:tetratricopeptide (TPR) repeat protein